MASSASITARIESVKALDGVVRSTMPPIPRSAKIELTARCDLHCYFCASHKRPRALGEMSEKFFMELASDLRELGVEQLGLFYIGESFLCEWLPEAIAYAKRECGYPYVFLTTNGSGATPERVRGCMMAGLDSLKFAFNWADSQQFECVTAAPAVRFDDVVQNIRAAREVRDDVQHETGHRCALYASSLSYDGEQRTRMQAVFAEIAPHVDQHYRLPLLGHWGLPGSSVESRPVPVKPLPCWPLFSEAHVTWDGKLSACSLDASDRFHMADLATTPFTEAWHSEAFRSLRASHLANDVRGTVCQRCIAYEHH